MHPFAVAVIIKDWQNEVHFMICTACTCFRTNVIM
ncbi:MAG: hypothetical protein K0S76_2518 [Herbinix sp.]|jgi:hypothetical protein|nr:hypothetical protein [Herbinix sp.]